MQIFERLDQISFLIRINYFAVLPFVKCRSFRKFITEMVLSLLSLLLVQLLQYLDQDCERTFHLANPKKILINESSFILFLIFKLTVNYISVFPIVRNS